VTAGEMAGGAIVPNDGPATDYGGSLTLSVFMSCLVAASGGLIFGYDIGISGPVFKTKLLILLALNSELKYSMRFSTPLCS